MVLACVVSTRIREMCACTCANLTLGRAQMMQPFFSRFKGRSAMIEECIHLMRLRLNTREIFRGDAARALELDVEDILPNLVVKQEVAQQFKLTPVPLPVDPPAKKAKKMMNEESLTDAAVPRET